MIIILFLFVCVHVDCTYYLFPFLLQMIAQQFDRTAREPLYFVPWTESGTVGWENAFYWTDGEGVRVGDPRLRVDLPFAAVYRHPMLFVVGSYI